MMSHRRTTESLFHVSTIKTGFVAREDNNSRNEMVMVDLRELMSIQMLAVAAVINGDLHYYWVSMYK